jgi:hypothetical protein
MKRHKAELIFLSSGAHGTESDYVNKELCRQLLEELNCQYWNNVKIVLRPEHVLVHSEADEKQIERKSDADGNSSDMGDCLCSTEIGYGSDKPNTQAFWDLTNKWFALNSRQGDLDHAFC